MSISPSHLSRFSPEFQLACWCCRAGLSGDDRAEIQRLLVQVDVPGFLDLVIARHRIGPLAHARLKQLPAAALAPGLMEPLLACARGNAVKALRSKRTHILLAQWFADAGIDWFAFKGITVAQRYYGDFAARQVNDLDIWVPAAKLLDARALLQAHGFWLDGESRCWDVATRGPRHMAFLTRYFHEEQHLSGEFGTLELHWQLTGNSAQFNLDPQGLLARADTMDIGGRPVRVMNDVDLLLYLCEHGGRHGWRRLKWLADLPRLLEQGRWDWPVVFERARSAGSVRTLALGLALARDLFGWVPPQAVLDELDSMRWLPLACRTVRYALQLPERAAERTIPYRMAANDAARALLLSGSWRTMASHLWRYALSPRDLRLVTLPDRWFAAYYALRPVLFALRRWRA